MPNCISNLPPCLSASTSSASLPLYSPVSLVCQASLPVSLRPACLVSGIPVYDELAGELEWDMESSCTYEMVEISSDDDCIAILGTQIHPPKQARAMSEASSLQSDYQCSHSSVYGVGAPNTSITSVSNTAHFLSSQPPPLLHFSPQSHSSQVSPGSSSSVGQPFRLNFHNARISGAKVAVVRSNLAQVQMMSFSSTKSTSCFKTKIQGIGRCPMTFITLTIMPGCNVWPRSIQAFAPQR